MGLGMGHTYLDAPGMNIDISHKELIFVYEKITIMALDSMYFSCKKLPKKLVR